MTVCGIKHADGVCVMGECPHIKTCCPVVWDKSGKPMTNEEWFANLSTGEKAEVFANATYSSAMMGAEITALPKEDEVRKWKMWLKAPHDWAEWLKQLHQPKE